MNRFDLVSSLQALPRTQPIKGDEGDSACESVCVVATVNVVQTVDAIGAD